VRMRILLWSLMLALSYTFLIFLISTSVELSIIGFITIFLLFIRIFKESFQFIQLLNKRIEDYKEFSFLASHLLALSKLNHNLDSLFVKTYEKYVAGKRRHSKFKTLLENMLKRRILVQLNTRSSKGKEEISSPFIKALWSIIKNLDSIDENSLSQILSSSYQLSKHLYQNAKRIKTFIKSERVKFQVLHIAAAMTLSFIIKTSFILAKYPFINVLSNPMILTLFSLIFILFSSSFTPLLQARFPSFKELAFSLLVFLAVLVFPTS